MIGSFCAAASCFWQPARSSVASAQVRTADAVRYDKKLDALTEGRKADDIVFLLMAPARVGISHGYVSRRHEDNRSLEKGNLSRTRIGQLTETVASRQAQSPPDGADLRKT
jgi:hypothetical protein